jgi:tetratricopeptide (TPR) repeat protein
LPLLGTPLGLELPDTPETELLADEFRKTRTEEVTRELLGMILLKPTIFVFDDTHWMDDASAELLRALTEGLGDRPWLVLVTRRDQPTGFAAAKEASPVVLALEPLDASHAAALANAATDELPFLPHEIEALTARAGGNPLFLTELLAAARQGEGIDELPDSVESLMIARIDRLSPAERRALRCAAVIGATFQPALVESALSDVSDNAIDWRSLEEFLVEEEGALRFRHALVRDAAYEGLPYRRRRELHERVGETIEQRSRRPDDEAALLSLHFFHAHAWDKAWRYSTIAGERAQAIYANVEAATFFERALATSRRRRSIGATDRADVLERLGDVRVRLSEFEKAAAAYRASRSQLGDDRVAEAQVFLKEAQVPSWLGKLPQALRCVTRGLSVLDGLEDVAATAERARLHALYAAVRTRQGRLLEAIKWCHVAVEEAQAADARDALAHAYFLLDWAYASLGRYDEAVYSPLALSIYEELGNLHRQGLVLNNMGVFAHFQGRWDDALDLYRRAEQAWEKMGDRWHVALATLNVGEVLADQGRVDEAEPLLRDALRVARASRSGPLLGDVTLRLGRLLSRSGRFEEAHTMLDEAREQYELEADARIAECLVLESDPDAALALSTAALARTKSLDGGFDVLVMLQRTRGCALLQLGRLDEARVALDAALQEARQRSLDYEVALALDATAALARIAGAPAGDLEHERDEILARLGVIAIAEIPLSALPK